MYTENIPLLLERIKKIIDERRSSANNFARELGMLEQTFGQQLRGQAKLSAITIVSILEKYPDISAEWLLRGEGTMYKTTNNSIANNATIGGDAIVSSDNAKIVKNTAPIPTTTTAPTAPTSAKDLYTITERFVGLLEKKDEQISKKDEQITRKDEQISKKDEQIERKDKQLDRKDEQITKRDEQFDRMLSIMETNNKTHLKHE